MPIFRQCWRTLWIDPILDEVVILSNDEVVVALITYEYESSYENDDEFELEEDGNALID